MERKREAEMLGISANEKFTGLSSEEVTDQRKIYGMNKLPEKKGTSPWSILISQFKSPLVYIILFAALVSLIVGEYGDFAIIMVVVVADVILGFVQEYRAQQTYEALKGLLKPTTTVIRNGEREEVEIWELVPGDLVILTNGERVPADGKLLEGLQVTLNEAILTGESDAVKKTELEGNNALYMGTTLCSGRAIMKVTYIGIETELGKIASSLQEHEEEETPLQVRLKAFSKTLTILVVAITAAILVSGLIMGKEFLSMLETSIILAIAAVPEGLLIAVTVIQVLGMKKILKRNGLVKRLLAVETLGSVSVICTDKTGTLTEGNMRVTQTDFNDEQRAFQVMLLCNDLEGPVDVALWDYGQAYKSDHLNSFIEKSARITEEMFSSETKFMATQYKTTEGDLCYLKGAPEIVMTMCEIDNDRQDRLLTQIDEWAGKGLRLLGLAWRMGGSLEEKSSYQWLGLVGMEDPVREGVQESIHLARHAGIQVKMITGDYRLTAERVALNIGLMEDGDRIIEGEQLQKLSDLELRREVKNISVFSRIRPNDKLRIVKALQENGEVTAMIGDGVNDAPALQRANIGVVVNEATDVAKETADLILIDSNFKTIVAAIEEGRIIFENIRKVVAYTLSNSFAEVLTIFMAMLFNWPAPLAVAQILWIHLICDGPSDIVLGFEPKEEGIMDEAPKSLKEPILTRLGATLIAIISISSAAFALSMFGHFYAVHHNPAEGQSIAFASFAINSMVYIFAYRSMRKSIFKSGPISRNKPLVWSVIAGLLTALIAFIVKPIRNLLGIVPLNVTEWLNVVGVALSLLIIVEIGKAISLKVHARKSAV
ncbi:cation-translocating P-type ATPase [Pelolinea submarina]|uniref:Ca2+-transporting ATPase n=1 Tax=Pelolinea submarina TaxID=913107 RepID=A0A347ZQ67_9CHLR|nr:cation-translocating P-type ATPase [Pelolinea submarina]REG06224.1 Ca2+-transporting ATPase [Pelolinea submarina]BBB47448.1 Ca2+-transporting ATPase [Pelolinea submarina]